MLNNIQNLRALAAYSVVIYHCLLHFISPQDPVGRAYLDLPSGGVDLFFVISGFIMVHTTREDETPAGFAIKRIARIVPLYWLATLVVVAMVMLKPWTFPTSSITAESVAASLLFIPYPDSMGYPWPVLPVGWTLNYEMMFYAAFALSLALPRAMRLPGVLLLITAVWAVGNLAGDSLAARFYANSIIFEFAAGCIIAHALRLKSVAAFARATPMWPFALAGFAVLAVIPILLPPEAPQLVKYGLASMLIVFAAAAQDLHRAPAPKTFVAQLGDASYSAYLLHKIVLVVTYTVAEEALGVSLAAAVTVTVVTVAATIVISLLSMKHFERPSAALVRGVFRRRASAAGH